MGHDRVARSEARLPKGVRVFLWWEVVICGTRISGRGGKSYPLPGHPASSDPIFSTRGGSGGPEQPRSRSQASGRTCRCCGEPGAGQTAAAPQRAGSSGRRGRGAAGSGGARGAHRVTAAAAAAAAAVIDARGSLEAPAAPPAPDRAARSAHRGPPTRPAPRLRRRTPRPRKAVTTWNRRSRSLACPWRPPAETQ